MRRSEMAGVLPAVVALIGFLGFLADVAAATSAPQHDLTSDNQPIEKTESRVLAATASGGHTSVVILLADQPDLSAAYGIADPDARGWYVYNTLRSHARRSQTRLHRALRATHIPHRSFWVANAIVADGDRTLVEWLVARDDVRAVESNLPQRWIEDPSISEFRESLTTSGAIEWGVSNVNAPQVWAMGYTGQGIVVGNQDTGMQWDHPALRPHYRGWNGVTADHNFNWHDAIHSGGGVCGASSPLPCDDHGHGTHTTGSAIGDDGAGAQIGVAPGAQWIGCRNMDRGNGTPATYMECFQFFLAPTDLNGNNPDPTRRPHVMNNSWVCPPSEGCATNTLQTTAESAEAAGIFVEASTGNAGPTCSTVQDPPAIYAAAFSTGAYDISNTLAGFSSRGPVISDGSNRMKPDIAGPGVNVRSSWPIDTYLGASGTSMAGPHVVGVVALLWSARPQLARDIATTKSILQSTANPVVIVSPAQVCGGISSSSIPNNAFGFGRVDALAAVNAVPPPSPLPSGTVPTATATSTLPPQPTPTGTPSPTSSATATPTRSATATPTLTSTASPSPTYTATIAPTISPTTTPTPTNSATATTSPSPTSSPTTTPTSTPTPTPNDMISGQIRYYSSNGAVPGAVVRLRGASDRSVQTDATGQFAFTHLPDDTWSIVPEKADDGGQGVSVLDAVYILQALAGTRTLDSSQVLACDVSGNGTLSTFDASLILQYKVGLISRFPVAETCGSDWAFVPTPTAAANQTLIQPNTTGGSCQPGTITYAPLQGPVVNQDFLGILFGDCTGNWRPSSGSTAARSAADTAAPLLHMGRPHRHRDRWQVPLYVDSAPSFRALDVEVRYDAARLVVLGVRPVPANRQAAFAVNTRTPGRIAVALASVDAIDGQPDPVLIFEFRPTSPVTDAAVNLVRGSVEDQPARSSGATH